MLITVLALGGCRRTPTPVLERIRVADTEGQRQLAAAGVTADDVSSAAAGALRQVGLGVAPARGDAPRLLAQVLVQAAEVVPAGRGEARVVVTIELSPLGEGVASRETGLGVEPLAERGGPEPALRDAVMKALAAAARSAGLQLAAEAKDDRRLVADLSSPDADVRDHAVRVLADRRNPAAVPALIERLHDTDPEVVDRAVGALVELGDRRAVAPLIELAHRRGGGAIASYARLVGDLGGPEARAWLETLAAGHPDPDVRAAAQRALAAPGRSAERVPSSR